MWKKVLGWSALTLVAIVAVGFSYLYFRQPAMAPPADIHVDMSAANIERGRYVFQLADCAGCHSPHQVDKYDFPPVEGKLAAGQHLPMKDLPGTVYARNITPDKETGIGTWTDGEKIRAIREGVSRDGHALFPMMPYGTFRYMSDRDVQALVAYLNSLPPVHNELGKTELKFPVSMLIKSAPRPVRGPVGDPDRFNKRVYGEYLTTLASCEECHTPREKGKLNSAKAFGGGQVFYWQNYSVVSANISPDKQTGIGDWDFDRFEKRFQMHREHMGKPIPATDPQQFTVMPWGNLSQLPTEDLNAIFTYLRTVRPVEQKIVPHPVDIVAKN
jgi:mono/diheme cytochrome c family protein